MDVRWQFGTKPRTTARGLLPSQDKAPAGHPPGWHSRVTAVHGASLFSAALLILYLGRHLWFFGDEWDFIADRRLVGGKLGLFAPHNEHWSTLPILVWRGLEAVVGLRSYLPYILVLVGTHLVLAHLLWRAARRVGADAWISTLLVALFSVLGSGAENLVWAFQIGFVGALAFGLGALLVADRAGMAGRARHLLAVWGLSLAALMCSGVGITMVVIVALVGGQRRGVKGAVLYGSLPVGAYAFWYVVFSHGHSGGPPVPATAYLNVGDYVLRGLRHAAEATSGLDGAGFLLVLALTIKLVNGPWLDERETHLARALAVGPVVFFTFAGVSRIGLGLEQADARRYVYIAGCLLIVPTAVALSSAVRRSLAARAVIVGFIGFATLHNLAAFHEYATYRVELTQLDRRTIVATGQLIVNGQILAGEAALPNPTLDPNLTVGDLRYLISDGELDLHSEASPRQRQAYLDAAARLATSISSTGTETVQGRDVVLVAAIGVSDGPRMGNCATLVSSGLESRVRLRFGPKGSVGITSSGGGMMRLYLATSADPTTVARPTEYLLQPDRPVLLRVSVPGGFPLLALPAGKATLCGLS